MPHGEWRPGVLGRNQLIKLKEKGIISNVNEESIDNSSFDLHLGSYGFEMEGSIKPLSHEDINSITQSHNKKMITISDVPQTLEKNKTYIFQLKESLKLPKDISGHATGRSSIGRLDVLTRLLASHTDKYDTVTLGHEGSLWLEISPITFSIKVKEGIPLHQLRLFKGEMSDCLINPNKIGLWGRIIFDHKGEPKDKNLDKLTLNLEETPQFPGEEICAFEAHGEENNTIDLTLGRESHQPQMYWIRTKPSEKIDSAINIIPENFYILRSRERFKLPKTVAIHCHAITENLGEIRIHYAGFVHPLFGQNRPDDKGAPLIFEVRGHNLDTYLRNTETLAELNYYSMSDTSNFKPGTYSEQELTLSTYFKDWS